MNDEPDDETDDKPGCDQDDCQAVHDPQTLEELRATLEHWRDHGYYGGCAHGC